jgi:hypothetical protein
MGDGGPGGGRSLTADDLDRVGAGVVQDDRNLAAGTVQVGLDHLQHEPRRDGGVEGIAALFQHRHASRGRQPVGRGDDAEGACDLRSGGERQGLAPPYHFAQEARKRPIIAAQAATAKHAHQGLRTPRLCDRKLDFGYYVP